MSICDEIRDWEDMTQNERFSAVRDRIKEMAGDWGFGDDVKVVRQAVPGYPNRRGGYDPDKDTIYLHPDLFRNGRGWEYAYDTAAHETAHHVQDEVDDAYAEDPEDLEDDPDAGHDGETDGDAGEPGDEDDDAGTEEEDDDVIDLRDEQRHAEAVDFAKAYLKAAREACAKDPAGAESALRSFLESWVLQRGAAPASAPSESGDWVLPAGGSTGG